MCEYTAAANSRHVSAAVTDSIRAQCEWMATAAAFRAPEEVLSEVPPDEALPRAQLVIIALLTIHRHA